MIKSQFGLSKQDISTLKKIIYQVKKDEKQTIQIFVFGSRAKGTFRKYSDLDLLIHANPKLDKQQIEAITENLEESNLPIRVDLVPHEELWPEYAQVIHQEKKLLFQF